MPLHLTMACDNYDRVRALITKVVVPEGVELDCTTQAAEKTFLDQHAATPYDICEMSLSSYFQARQSGNTNYIALPIFLSRVFRHSSLYVRGDSDLTHPKQLTGRRVGIVRYRMSGAVWLRGILQDDYGLAATDVIWVSQNGTEVTAASNELDQLKDMVSSMAVEKPPLEVALAAGHLDAIVSMRTPRSIAAGTGEIRHLFTDVGTVERAYFKRTGIFPIMHVLVLKQELCKQYPWLPGSLFTAFLAAKDLAAETLLERNVLEVMLPFAPDNFRETQALMGRDFWSYGYSENRNVLETFIRYLRVQEMVKSTLELDQHIINCS